MRPRLLESSCEPVELNVLRSSIDTLAPASSSPSSGVRATPAPPPDPITAACHWMSSGPVFSTVTTFVQWSASQPNRTLLGVTCSQPEKGDGLGGAVGLGVAVGLGEAAGLGRVVGLAVAVAVARPSAAPGADGPVRAPSGNAPAWLSRR